MKITETISAFGHENIWAIHRSTLEITRKKDVSKRGDCIIAASADKGFVDLSLEFKRALTQESAKLAVWIAAGGIVEIVKAFGSSRLILSHPTDIVVRKSSYVCERTLAINADKAAIDLARRLVKKLKNPTQNLKITLVVEV